MNIRTELLRKPEFASANKGAIETWLRVLAYCCEQENGGRLESAAKWNDRTWMATCGVTKAEVEDANPLLYDDAVDYFVSEYPEDKEAEVQAKRKGGKKGGKRSAASRASSSASTIAATEGEGGKESEGKENLEKKSKGTVEEVCSFCLEIGLPKADGEASFHKWESNGWKVGNAQIKCWRSTIRSWKAAGYMPSQKQQPSKSVAPQSQFKLPGHR